MQIEQITIKQVDGHTSKIKHYVSKPTSKGNILILHGMAEHHIRYDNFAQYLCNHQFDVYLYDHRGHGTHLPAAELGFFGPKNGYQLVINDAIHILKQIKSDHAEQPLFLFGHSMGSIITRNVIQSYDSLDGAIICSTANPTRLKAKAGLLVSFFSGYQLHPKEKSPLMDQIIFGGKDYKKLNTRTHCDWVSKNEKNVDQYIKDKFCGFICTKSFYHDLLKLTNHATTPSKILRTRKTLPLLIVCGDSDPVGGMGQDVKRLYDFYVQHGYQDVTFKIYPEGRHEILNDDCAPNVYEDIDSFLDRLTASAKE